MPILAMKFLGITGKAWLILLAVAAVIGSIWYYGNARYNAGVDATDAKWVAAGEKLKVQAEAATTIANDYEVERVNDHLERLEEEKERIDEAEAAGASSFDVLFGA